MRRPAHLDATRKLAVIAGAFLAVACDSTEPRGPGSISVTASSSIQEPIFFIYSIAIDSGTPMLGFAGEPLTFIARGLAHGRHTVTATDIPVNCHPGVGGLVREVHLRGDDTATVAYTITCQRTTGDLRVNVTTTGNDLDANGYVVMIDGQAGGAVPANGMTTVQFVNAGSHAVSLADVATNCTGGGSQTTAIAAGATSVAAFNIRCEPVAIVRFATSIGGTDRDPDAFTLTIGNIAPVRGTSATRLISVPVGTHSYSIGDVQPNCTLNVAASGSITVAAGDTVTITGDATCTSIGLGTAGTTVTDPAADTLPNQGANPTPALDLIGVTARYATGWTILVLRFSKPILSSNGAQAGGLHGYIDLDVDENVNTGGAPAVDFFGGTASQGSDYLMNFFDTDSVSIHLFRIAGLGISSEGRVRAKFEADSVVISIPVAKLGGDDGNMTLSAVLGTSDRPTDILPNAGAVTVRVPSSIVAKKTVRQRAGAESPAVWIPRTFGKWRLPR